MTTYARKIAEAVRDAAIDACRTIEDRCIKENQFQWPELRQSSETGAQDCEYAVKALDLDAIIAGMPHCDRPEGCVCGGDTDTVRATCHHWQGQSEQPVCKAMQDAIEHGAGAYRINPDGTVEHVPHADLQPQSVEPKGLTEGMRYVLSEALHCLCNLPDGHTDHARHAAIKAILRALLTKGE